VSPYFNESDSVCLMTVSGTIVPKLVLSRVMNGSTQGIVAVAKLYESSTCVQMTMRTPSKVGSCALGRSRRARSRYTEKITILQVFPVSSCYDDLMLQGSTVDR